MLSFILGMAFGIAVVATVLTLHAIYEDRKEDKE